MPKFNPDYTWTGTIARNIKHTIYIGGALLTIQDMRRTSTSTQTSKLAAALPFVVLSSELLELITKTPYVRDSDSTAAKMLKGVSWATSYISTSLLAGFSLINYPLQLATVATGLFITDANVNQLYISWHTQAELTDQNHQHGTCVRCEFIAGIQALETGATYAAGNKVKKLAPVSLSDIFSFFASKPKLPFNGMDSCTICPVTPRGGY